MPVIIETPRLILRPLTQYDFADLVRGLNNFNVSRNTARIPFPYAMADAEEFLAIASQTEAAALRLSITLKEGGDIVCGGATYEPRESGAEAEIGYWLAEPQWGKGYGTEAAHAMVDHAFEVAGYAKMVARYRLANDASRRILEGLGFVKTSETTCASRAEGAETLAAMMVLTHAAWTEAKGRAQ